MKKIKSFRQYIGSLNEQDSYNPKDLLDSAFDDLIGMLKGIGSYDSTLGPLLQALGLDPISGIYDEDRIIPADRASAPQTQDAKKNYEEIEKAMTRHGITNKFTRAAIQGVIGKECGWEPRPEESYANTSDSKIQETFGKRVSGVDISALKKDETKFWDRVYGPDDPTGAGPKSGNTSPGDGAKYRGNGFNGITFKNNYIQLNSDIQKMNKLGKSFDIVQNPSALNDPDTGAEASIIYFLSNFERDKSIIQSKYGVGDINGFKDVDNAVKTFCNINSGIGSDLNRNSVIRKGVANALASAKKIISGGESAVV